MRVIYPKQRGASMIGMRVMTLALAAAVALLPGTAFAKGEALHRFSVGGKRPRSVIVVHVDTVFFQCARAIFRSKLWDPDRRIERGRLPSLGTIVSDITHARFDGKKYDDGLYERLKGALY